MSVILQLIPGVAALVSSIAAVIWSIRRDPVEGGDGRRRKLRPKSKRVTQDRPRSAAPPRLDPGNPASTETRP